MDLHEYLQITASSFVMGGLIYGYPLVIAVLSDAPARKLSWQSRSTPEFSDGTPPNPRQLASRGLSLAFGLILSLAGSGAAAVAVYLPATYLLSLIDDTAETTVNVAIAATCGVFLFSLALLTSFFNFEGQEKRQYFPGILSEPSTASDCTLKQYRRRSYELGRFQYSRLAAATTAIAFTATFAAIPFVLGRVSFLMIGVVCGSALGALAIAFAALLLSRRRYAAARLLNLISQELLPSKSSRRRTAHLEAGPKREFDRRDEMATLLRRYALKISSARKYESFSGSRAQIVALLGASRYLKAFSDSDRSLEDELPDDVRAILQSVALVLMGAPDKRFLRQLKDHVGAFDASGNPDPELVAMTKFGFRKHVEGIEPFIRGLQAIIVLAVGSLMILLAALGLARFDFSPF